MGREFELKYRADETVIAAIEAEFGPFLSISMETTYYDTPDRALRSRYWTLRRRYENGKAVCTVKTPAPGGGRGEWEVPSDDIMDAIPELIRLGAPMELAALTAPGVTAVCGARFTRLAAMAYPEGCAVELALDRGVLLGGGRELPLAEVEVELKAGSEAAAIRFARELAAKYGLISESKSKVRRAMDLLHTGE